MRFFASGFYHGIEIHRGMVETRLAASETGKSRLYQELTTETCP